MCESEVAHASHLETITHTHTHVMTSYSTCLSDDDVIRRIFLMSVLLLLLHQILLRGNTVLFTAVQLQLPRRFMFFVSVQFVTIDTSGDSWFSLKDEVFLYVLRKFSSF